MRVLLLLLLVSVAVNAQDTLRLKWHPAPTAVGYRVQISDVSDFSRVTIDSLRKDTCLGCSTDTTKELHLLAGEAYYWRVASFNADGQGPWSSPWRFMTRGTVSVKLVSPASGAVVRRGGQVFVTAIATTAIGVSFFVNGLPIGAVSYFGSGDTTGTTWTVPAGKRMTYSLTATATDGITTATSPVVKVTSR